MIFTHFVKLPLISLPVLAAALFAWFADARWVGSSLAVTTFVDSMGLIFPPVSHYSKRSAFPEVSGAYFAFAILLAPLHFHCALKQFRTESTAVWFNSLWQINSKWEFVNRPIAMILVFSISIFMLFINPGYDFKLLPINSSRAALGLFGWVFVGAIPAWCMAWVYCNWLVLKDEIFGGVKE